MLTLHFNNTTLDVQESDSSYRYRSLMSKPQLVLKFSLSEFVEIPVGAWCEYQGVKYKLGSPENIKKNGTRNIEYTLTLGTLEDNMSLYKMRNPVDKRLKWSMCAKPHELVEAIVWNLNQRDGAGVWKVGECLDAAEQTVEFNHTYVDAALQDVANKFETEWEINDYTISLHKVEYFKDDPLPLAYGKGNGFEPGVGRTTQSDELPIKRLYVQGGDRNIDRSKYGSAELLLPKSQTLVYEGRIYQSDAEGYSIERIDKVSDAVKEDSLDCSEIYPSRVGTVSAVECIDAGKNFYDIIDNSIPAELNFNDYVIEGETATIIFQKGMLAGDDKQFEFKYNHSERRFELVPQEIDGVTMPNETFSPAVGDTYAIFGIMLPDSYICNNTDKTGASWDMFREAARKLYENEDQKFTFTGTLQGLWAKKNWLRVGGRLKVGGYVLFTDEQFAPDGIPIRITGIKEFLTSPYAPVLEISNSVSGKSVSSQLREIGQNEVATDNSIRNAVSYTKRRFRDVRETMAMLEDSMLDNFTNSINPLTVQTMMMLIGDESLQFRFVASKTDLTAVGDGITYDNTAKQLHIPHGFIQHMTLGIGTISSSHADSEYKVWEMNEYLSPYLDNGAKKYYLYAKVSRTDTTVKGDFLLSDRAIKMTDVAGYYHLLVGILNSEYDGERSYVSLYGFSEILPGRITTDKIVSSDGKTYFDLLLGEIGGNIKFIASDGSLKDVADLERTDLDYLKEAFKDATTEIDGGVALSGFVGVRDALKNVIAALCGYNPTSEDDYPLIFAGAQQGNVEYYGWTSNSYTHIYTQSATPSNGDNCFDNKGSVVGTVTNIVGAQIFALSTTGETYQRNTGIDFTAKTPSAMEGNRAKFRVYKDGRCVSNYFETSGSYKTIYVPTYCPPLVFTTVLDVSENCYMDLTAGAQFGVLMETNDDYDGYNCSLYNSSRYPCTVVKGTKSSYTQVGALSPGEMMDFVNIKGGWVLKNFTRYSTKE
nr:MAG TPA: tail protein [Crassvirales sp.]